MEFSVEESVHKTRNARSDGTAAKRFEGSSRFEKKSRSRTDRHIRTTETATASERTRRTTRSLGLITRLAGISPYDGTRLDTMPSPPFPCAVAADKA